MSDATITLLNSLYCLDVWSDGLFEVKLSCMQGSTDYSVVN